MCHPRKFRSNQIANNRRELFPKFFEKFSRSLVFTNYFVAGWEEGSVHKLSTFNFGDIGRISDLTRLLAI